MKFWNGEQWLCGVLKFWNGAAWTMAPLKYWNGVEWATDSCYIVGASDLFVISGYSNPSALKDTDGYAPDTWTNKTDCPDPARYLASTAALDSKIYVWGGVGFLDDNDQYDPDTWTSKTGLIKGKTNTVAAKIDSKGYVIGGAASGTGYFSETDEYTTADSWTNMTDYPSPIRYYTSACSISNEKGYLVGGYYSGSRLRDTDQYDPDTWTSVADCPLPGRDAQGTFEADSKMYIVGGWTGSVRLQDTDEYVSNTWSSKTDCPLPARANNEGSEVGGKGYTTGGNDSVGELQDIDEYNTSDSWASKTDMPSPTRYSHVQASI